MRLAEAANIDPMHGEYRHDPPERKPPHPWVSRLALVGYGLAWPFVWLWRKLKEWTL